MNKGKSSDVVEKKESFFEKMKNDSKYNAKVQLLGYGLLIAFLVIYLNLSNIGGGVSKDNDTVGDVNGDSLVEDSIDNEKESLLDKVKDNYIYDIVINLDKKSINIDTNEEIVVSNSILYKGKSYGNKMEINKVLSSGNEFYYKVNDNYYNKVDNIVSNVNVDVVYNIVDVKYVELANILKFINFASLDHVTDYSSGKREYVYHLKVKDIIGNFSGSDVIEMNVVEEDGLLKIEIDYSNLFKATDENIVGCGVVVTITDINKVEDFEVVIGD